MKISVFNLSIQPGKYKYQCPAFDELVEKFSPQKKSPYVVEFLREDFEKTDAIVFDIKKKLDLVVIDLEKIEKRLQRTEDEGEKQLLAKVQERLEREVLICDMQFSPEEHALLKNLSLVTYKPCVGKDAADDINGLVKELIDKSGRLLFFTVGKKEVRAWDIKRGDTVLDAAGRIHSDLARGFIKAEVVNAEDLLACFNLQEAKTKGLVKLVDRDYVMAEGDVIDVKFNV